MTGGQLAFERSMLDFVHVEPRSRRAAQAQQLLQTDSARIQLMLHELGSRALRHGAGVAPLVLVRSGAEVIQANQLGARRSGNEAAQNDRGVEPTREVVQNSFVTRGPGVHAPYGRGPQRG